jgi:hypothetical protein
MSELPQLIDLRYVKGKRQGQPTLHSSGIG